ncbi:hypothetical protein AX14_006704 [Amanita brunnescens Koide BX004]|nr:hypothetical protein AX14_006704 [Amanita brunnescens Koide BX004]
MNKLAIIALIQLALLSQVSLGLPLFGSASGTKPMANEYPQKTRGPTVLDVIKAVGRASFHTGGNPFAMPGRVAAYLAVPRRAKPNKKDPTSAANSRSGTSSM